MDALTWECKEDRFSGYEKEGTCIVFVKERSKDQMKLKITVSIWREEHIYRLDQQCRARIVHL